MNQQNLVELLKAGRTVISDEKALQSIEVFPHWESVIGKELTQEDVEQGHDRYQHNGTLYRLVQPHTPQENWPPDQTRALWTEISLEEWPLWRQPTGAQDAYRKGAQVTWQDRHWISDVDANTWEPGAYGWTETALEPEQQPEQTEPGQEVEQQPQEQEV